MPVVQDECSDRIRLIDAYGKRAAELARVIQALKPAGDMRDSIIVNQATSRCEEAWQELEQHISEHGCGPRIPRTDQIKADRRSS